MGCESARSEPRLLSVASSVFAEPWPDLSAPRPIRFTYRPSVDEAPWLTDRWTARWSGSEPIAHELPRLFADRWVRFHAPPGVKRYPQNDAELDEVLFQHNAVVSDLITIGGPGSLAGRIVVVTCSWSGAEQPAPQHPDVAPRQPDASFWRSVRRGNPGFDSWTHLWASERQWETGCLDGLFALVATDRTHGVLVADEDFAWLYHPYGGGGGDVIAPSAESRDRIAEHRASWLSHR